MSTGGGARRNLGAKMDAEAARAAREGSAALELQPARHPNLELARRERDLLKEQLKGSPLKSGKVKQAEAAKAAEERIQRAIRRSQEPVARRTGKPIMFRSYLPQSKPKEAVAEKLETGPEKLETDLDFYLNLP